MLQYSRLSRVGLQYSRSSRACTSIRTAEGFFRAFFFFSYTTAQCAMKEISKKKLLGCGLLQYGRSSRRMRRIWCKCNEKSLLFNIFKTKPRTGTYCRPPFLSNVLTKYIKHSSTLDSVTFKTLYYLLASLHLKIKKSHLSAWI